MMKPLYKQPLIEAAILASGIMCTVLLIHGVQNFIAMGGKPATSQIAEKSNPDLVQVAAGSFPLGDTCNRPGVCSANNYSSDDPPIINPGSVPEAYDLDRYAVKDAVSGTHAVSEAGYKSSELDGAGADMYPKLCTMFGNTFPKTFTKATKHRSNAGDNNTPSADGATVFEFTLPAGTPITVPVSGRNILHGLDSAGNGPEGMIMYAEADRFAFQIGRKDFLKNIWIYVMDVNVDPGLLSAYQSANAAGRDKLPEVTTGQVLATSRGTVRIGVRDVGKLLDLRHIYPWDPGFITSLGITKRCTQDTSAPLPDGGGPGPGGGTKLDLNVQCTDDAKCLSGNCSLQSNPSIKLCKQGTSVPGADCTDKSQCASDKCESGKCVAQAPGTHTVSGTITVTGAGNDGNLVFAQLYKVSDNALVQATTPSASRAYSISGVEKGQYKIKGFLVKPGHIIGQAVIAQSDYAIVTVGEGNVPNQDLTIDAPAATTSTVSGTITLAGGIGTNKVRVQIFNDAATPVLKYQNDPSTNLTYSIPGVINGTYQIHADLINSADTITSSSPDRAFVVRGSDIKDLDLSIPAPAAAPPTTGLPDWVTENKFCYDTSKDKDCAGRTMGFSDTTQKIYCADNAATGTKLLPLRKIHDTEPGYPESCYFANRSYLPGTRSILVTKGTQRYGVPVCVYTAYDNDGDRATCNTDDSCSKICSITPENVNFTFIVENKLSVAPSIFQIDELKMTINNGVIPGAKIAGTTNFTVSMNKVAIRSYIKSYSGAMGSIIGHIKGKLDYTTGLDILLDKVVYFEDLPKQDAQFKVSIIPSDY